MNISSFGLSPIRLSSPPQQTGLSSTPFYARPLCQTKMLPSGGGDSCVHRWPTRQTSFAVSFKLRSSHLEVGHLAFTARQYTRYPFLSGILRSCFDNAMGILCCGASHIHGSTTIQAYISISFDI